MTNHTPKDLSESAPIDVVRDSDEKIVYVQSGGRVYDPERDQN